MEQQGDIPSLFDYGDVVTDVLRGEVQIGGLTDAEEAEAVRRLLHEDPE